MLYNLRFAGCSSPSTDVDLARHLWGEGEGGRERVRRRRVAQFYLLRLQPRVRWSWQSARRVLAF